MIPDLVRFTWKDSNKNEVKLSDTDDLLVQKDEGQEARVTSMLIIDQQQASSNTYICSVQHEDKDFTIPFTTDEGKASKGSDSDPDPTCPPPQEDNVQSSGLAQGLYLFNLTYVSLLVKNMLYFCAVGVLMYKRRPGNSETVSTSSPTPKQND
ncbi:hypothetical protein NFI96_031427 [Prochilodus magdalenae]|nr:hypothetical protein NFI96_031427 [Prochilodus magdalenae]